MAHAHHDHSHSHHHGHAPNDGESALGLTLLLTGSFMIVEVIGGVLSGSLALLADAGHMLSDTAALALAWLGFRLGRRSPDASRSFGYARFEVLAGAVNGIAMLLLVGWIFFEAFARIREPAPVLAGPMLVVAVIGLGVNLIAFRLLHGHGDHVNTRGALLHVIGDLLGSVAAIVAAVVIMTTGWTPIDPLLSILVGLLVLRSAASLLRQTAHILLEGTPSDVDPAALRELLAREVDGLIDVHHLHVWSLTSGRNLATMHVRITEQADVGDLLAHVKRLLTEHFGLDHTTVQICPEHCPDEMLTGTNH